MTTSVPTIRATLSSSPKVRMAKALTGSGVSAMTASPTAMTGEDAGRRGRRPARRRRARRPRPAARPGRRGRGAPGPAGRGDGVRGAQRSSSRPLFAAGPIGIHPPMILGRGRGPGRGLRGWGGADRLPRDRRPPRHAALGAGRRRGAWPCSRCCCCPTPRCSGRLRRRRRPRRRGDRRHHPRRGRAVRRCCPWCPTSRSGLRPRGRRRLPAAPAAWARWAGVAPPVAGPADLWSACWRPAA